MNASTRQRRKKGLIAQKQKPVHEIRLGRIRVAIWANQSNGKGVWFNTTIVRLYKDGDEWKETAAYGRDDLSPPQYDLALIAPQLTGVAATEVMAGPEQTAAAQSPSMLMSPQTAKRLSISCASTAWARNELRFGDRGITLKKLGT